MENVQYRSVIRFLVLDGKSCMEIKEKMDAVYKDFSASLTTIRYWFHEFKRGHTSFSGEEPSGRPIEIITEEMIEWPTKKVREIVGILHEHVLNILHQQLEIKKLSARWVPCLLTVD